MTNFILQFNKGHLQQDMVHKKLLEAESLMCKIEMGVISILYHDRRLCIVSDFGHGHHFSDFKGITVNTVKGLNSVEFWKKSLKPFETVSLTANYWLVHSVTTSDLM